MTPEQAAFWPGNLVLGIAASPDKMQQSRPFFLSYPYSPFRTKLSHTAGKCAQKRIQLRQTALFYKAHKEYGNRVAEGLELDVKEIQRLAEMSQDERAKATEK